MKNIKFSKALLILGLGLMMGIGFDSIALAAKWSDPGGIISKSSNKVVGIGIGISLVGFLASWILQAASFGDESVIQKGRKAATAAVVSGMVLAVGTQIYSWFLA